MMELVPHHAGDRALVDRADVFSVTGPPLLPSWRLMVRAPGV